MPHLVQPVDFFSLCGLAAAAALLGLAGLLLPRRPAARGWRGPLALAALLGAAGGLARAAAAPQPCWLAPCALAGVTTALGLARTQAFQAATRGGFAALALPRVQAALLLVGGAAVLGSQLYQFENEDDSAFLAGVAGAAAPVLDELPQPARTDAGRPVPLYAARPAADPAPTAESEERLLEAGGLARRVIQTGKADLECNCHGWVFTAGRHWVRGAFVERILQDNGYQAVARPRRGDVAVWRDERGAVTHSGLVRSAEDGVVLLESKWGQAGRFVHTLVDHPYSTARCSLYHTPRGSHLLRGTVRPSPAGRAVALGS